MGWHIGGVGRKEHRKGWREKGKGKVIQFFNFFLKWSIMNPERKLI